jgi:predicted Rossmann-fold nucleotide-binding protein
MIEKKRIAVFGGSECTAQTAEAAEMVGKLLAEKGVWSTAAEDQV